MCHVYHHTTLGLWNDYLKKKNKRSFQLQFTGLVMSNWLYFILKLDGESESESGRLISTCELKSKMTFKHDAGEWSKVYSQSFFVAMGLRGSFCAFMLRYLWTLTCALSWLAGTALVNYAYEYCVLCEHIRQSHRSSSIPGHLCDSQVI